MLEGQENDDIDGSKTPTRLEVIEEKINLRTLNS